MTRVSKLHYVLLACVLSACVKESDDSREGEWGRGMRSTPMAKIHSGYSSERSDWRKFLACWRNGVTERLFKVTQSTSLKLSPDENLVGGRVDSVVKGQVEEVEKRLGHRLPKSFVDFHMASEGTGWYSFIDGYDLLIREKPKSLYPLQLVDKLAVADKKALRIWTEAGTDSVRRPPDEEYYRYGHGSGQVDSGFDGPKLRDMVKVGGLSQGTLILLNPFEVTQDGEMETWVLAHWHGLIRYKSFAEAVREMAYRDVGNRGGFLLSTSDLLGSKCSSLIAID